SFVTNDDDVAGLDFLGKNRRHHFRLRVEYARRAGDRWILESGDLRHAAFWREIAAENGQMTLRIHGIVERPDHVLVHARPVRHVRQLLGYRAAGDRHAIAVEPTGDEQHLEHLRNAAGAMEIDGDVLARRLQIAQHRHTLADALEIVD